MATIAQRLRRRAAATIASRLTLEGIGRRFGRVTALDSIDLNADPGEIVSLLGHSGCGKSTLLRIAAGVDVPTSGRVLVDGREVASDKVFVPPEKRSIGLMFQDYALFPHRTVLGNVKFGLLRLDRQTREQEALAALDRVGLAHLAASYPHEISGGEQQRVALARAIVPRPGILLMDEPFSGLDSRLRDSVRADTLSVLRETGATAIIVTHDPEEAMRMSDRIVLMRGGRIVQHGSAESLYDRPQDLFVARFFSHLNELPGTVQSGRALTRIGDICRRRAQGGAGGDGRHPPARRADRARYRARRRRSRAHHVAALPGRDRPLPCGGRRLGHLSSGQGPRWRRPGSRRRRAG